VTVAKRKKAQPWDAVFSQVKVGIGTRWLPLRPSDADLDAAEKQLGCKFPHSYRAFVQKFGHGVVMECAKVLPFPTKGKTWDIFTNTQDRRKAYRNLTCADADLLLRGVYFAESNYGDDYFWDPLDVTNQRSCEYRVYLNRCRTTEPEIVADTFHEFISWVDQDVRSWWEADRLERCGPGIHFQPDPLVERRRPTKKNVALWLSFNNNTVRDLALSIRDHGRTDAFPILADALEEAGCTNADLLDSCRTGDSDIDGVWVLQVLLGKA
jgi:hypothetical protein